VGVGIESAPGAEPGPDQALGHTYTYVDDPDLIVKEAVDKDSIKFKAHVWKVGTLGTGGLRVILNLDQEFIKEMAMLAECQHGLIELEFEATAREE